MAHHIKTIKEFNTELKKAIDEGVIIQVFREQWKPKNAFIYESAPTLTQRIFLLFKHLPRFISAFLSGKPTYSYGLYIEKEEYFGMYSLESCVIDMLMTYASNVFEDNNLTQLSDEAVMRFLRKAIHDDQKFVEGVLFFGRTIHADLHHLSSASVINDIREHLHVDHCAMVCNFLKTAKMHAVNVISHMDEAY